MTSSASTNVNSANSIKSVNFLRHLLAVLFFFSAIYTLFFLPALAKDLLLAPGDGYVQSIPAYYSPRVLWTSLILGGFPVAADVTPQTWYPVSWLLSLIPNSWNAFVIAAYVLASSFCYAYVYYLTQSTLAGLVSGITYGACGFMMAHLGHTSMVHTAAWIPLLILACERLRVSKRPNVWMAILAIAIACIFLAGHPQISVYGIGLTIIYAAVFGWEGRQINWKFYRQFTYALLLGVGLASIQILPTAELARVTPRAAMSFEDFLLYSLPIHEIPVMLFPYLFGGGTVFPFQLPYIGLSPPTEGTLYVGLMPMILAAMGLTSVKPAKKLRLFWLTVAIIAFCLALGPSTPFAWLSYKLPGYGKFRIVTRHGIELALAVSILAGFGIEGLQRRRFSPVTRQKTLNASLIIMVLMLIAGNHASTSYLVKMGVGVTATQIQTFLIPVMAIPFGFCLLAIFTIRQYANRPSAKAVQPVMAMAETKLTQPRLTSTTFRSIALLLVLMLDLSSFGWFYEWQNGPIRSTIMEVPPIATKYNQLLQQSQQRLLVVEGGLAPIPSIPPNLSRLWKTPSLGGYGPLLPTRSSEVLSMKPWASLISPTTWLHPSDRSLDVAAVRYLFINANEPTNFVQNGVSWTNLDLGLTFGRNCVPPASLTQLDLPAESNAIEADQLAIVGTLGCASGILQDTDVLDIEVTDSVAKKTNVALKAGRDLAEFSFDCPTTKPLMKHQRAPVFSPPPGTLPASDCSNRYVAKIPLNGLKRIQNLNFKLPATNSGAITIDKISLINSTTGVTSPWAKQWQPLEAIGPVRVYENPNAMPRAWLTPTIVVASKPEVLKAIKTSKLPDGRRFEPKKMALVETSVPFSPQPTDPNAVATIQEHSETNLSVQTQSAQSAFLVLADTYYPGWEATIDGKASKIFQTNYISRGVVVPAGKHTVEFKFNPLSFRLGLGICMASFALLLYLLVIDYRLNSSNAAVRITNYEQG
jgi:hypothetical protein